MAEKQTKKEKSNAAQIITTAFWAVFATLALCTMLLFSFVTFKYYQQNLSELPPEKQVYKENEYSMIYLNSGLFYFCKLRDYNSDFYQCNSPYYLVTRQEKQSDGSTIPNTYITTPSSEEIYKPDGPYYLKKNDVVYITEIGSKSPVLEYIKGHEEE